MEYISLIVGILIFVTAVVLACKRRDDASKRISYIMVGIFFATFLMMLPTEWINGETVSNEPMYIVISSLFYAFKALGGGQDLIQIETIALTGVARAAYIGINYLIALLGPILTSSLVLSFVGDTGEKMRYAFKWSKKCHVFSVLNENALQLAKGIQSRKERTTVVFCDTKDVDKALKAEARECGFILLYKPCENMRLSRRFDKYEFYLLNVKEDENIQTAEALIKRHHAVEKTAVKINAFAESGTNINLLEQLLVKPICHIFECLNADSLQAARALNKKDPRETVVFLRAEEAEPTLADEAVNSGYSVHKGDIARFRPYPTFKNYQFVLHCMQGEQPPYAFDKKKLKVYRNRLTEEWVDDPVQISFIDEIALFCDNLLFEHPLFASARTVGDRKLISLMIVGCGRLGMRMLKTAVWCGQMMGYTLKIRVYDQHAEKNKREFYKQCPELNRQSEYDIKFIEADFGHSDFAEKVQESSDATYVVVAAGSDELNINTAEYLFRVFRKQNGFENTPPIFARVRENVKVINLSEGGSFLSTRNIRLFGTTETIFSDRTLFNTKLEKLSFAVHLCYWGALNEPKNSFRYHEVMTDFESSEYNRRSSMATALHIAAKLKSSLPDGNGDISEQSANDFARLIAEQEDWVEKLAQNEHDRWNAFMRSEGYSQADIATMKVYAHKTGSHKDELSKLHPCITDWDGLDTLSNTIREELPFLGKPDFKEYDREIVRQIPAIIRKAVELEQEDA